ncbi:hypothetical protein [Streptomyces kaempferi]|uniref:Uncharacterized protein n=1 Tax=Streptomyces kaempferi TaxID=333725 RepID=A0ABW3XUX0_9ACTN
MDVTADDAGRLRFAADGPGEGRQRRQFVLRHKPSDDDRRPDLPLRTVPRTLDNGATRYTAALTPSALDELVDGRRQVTMHSPKSPAVHMKASLRDTRSLIDARERDCDGPP